MIDIDQFLVDATTRNTIPDFASPNDVFTTSGSLQWADRKFALRSGHVLDFKGATLELDVDRVSDEMLRAEQPIVMLPSLINNIYDKPTPEERWAAVLTRQVVQNVRLVGNFSKLQPRAKALGVSLRVCGCQLLGHDAHMNNITLVDFGAYRVNPDRGAEAFPLVIAGADSGYDKTALFTVDPSYVFERANIEYRFEGYAPDFSNDQVTVGIITGATCSEKIQESPWAELGPWRQIMRREARLRYYVVASGKNSVQGGTIYQSLTGYVDGTTDGATIGYYSDYLRSKGVCIPAKCSFKNGVYGVVVRLSPTAQDAPGLPEQFSAEDFVIEKFTSNASVADVFVNEDLMQGRSANPPTRYLRNIAVDERLRIAGNRKGLVLIPSPDTKKRGCNPFKR